MKYNFPICLSALLLAACTQDPAQVVLHTSEDFSRNAVASSAASAPVVASIPVSAPSLSSSAADAPTSQTASVSAISSSDLPPPSATAAAAPAPKSTPFGSATPAPAPAPKVAEAKPQAKTQAKAKPVQQASAAPAPVVLHHASNVAYIWPVEGGHVIGHFGPQGKGKINDGIAIAADSGEPVYAAATGMVSFTGDQLKGYGHMVLITHKNGMHTTYAHLSKVAVKQHQNVRQGDIIGYVGSSGNVAKPQLYFSMRNGIKPVNPEHYLSSAYAAN